MGSPEIKAVPDAPKKAELPANMQRLHCLELQLAIEAHARLSAESKTAGLMLHEAARQLDATHSRICKEYGIAPEDEYNLATGAISRKSKA
jgi:hypothetical protein